MTANKIDRHSGAPLVLSPFALNAIVATYLMVACNATFWGHLLRIFEGQGGKFDRSLADVGGGILAVSQFTLYGDTRRGRRPDFSAAAGPEIAQALYERVIARWRETGYRVATGVFGAHMVVELENDGPVTIWMDTA